MALRISELTAGTPPYAAGTLLEVSVANPGAPSGYDSRRATLDDIIAPDTAANLAAVNERLQLTTERPFVLVIAGQSNAVGQDESGSKTIETGIKIWNGSGMITAAFGTPPLSGGSAGLGYNNHAGIHFANYLRRAGISPPEREIWIIPNGFSGNSIANWVGAGAASTNFVALVNAIAGAGVTAIDALMWLQGEADSLSTETGYNTDALYEAGFETLKTQWRALPQWQDTTVITVQELGTWGLAGANFRNGYFWTIPSGIDNMVQLISSAGCTMGAEPVLDDNHFSGESLVEIGQRHFAAWVAAMSAHGNAGVPLRTARGYPMSPMRVLTIDNTTTFLAVDDLRNGAMIDVANSTIELPITARLPGAVLLGIFVRSGTCTLNCVQAISMGSDGDLLSAVLPVGQYQFQITRQRWRLVARIPLVGNSIMKGSGNLVAAADVTLTDANLQNALYICFSNAILIPSPSLANNGRRAMFVCRSVSTKSVTIGIDGGATQKFALQGAVSSQPILVDSLTMTEVGQIIELVEASDWWMVTLNTQSNIQGLKHGGTLAPTAGVYTFAGAQCRNLSYRCPAGKYVLPNPTTLDDGGMVALIADLSSAIQVETAAGTIIDKNGTSVPTGSTITVPMDRCVILQPIAPSRWRITGGDYLAA